MDDEIIIRQFEAIEQRIEKLLDVCRTYEAEKSELENKIKSLEGELEGKAAAESRLVKERDLIRSRVDALLGKLESVTES